MKEILDIMERVIYDGNIKTSLIDTRLVEGKQDVQKEVVVIRDIKPVIS